MSNKTNWIIVIIALLVLALFLSKTLQKEEASQLPENEKQEEMNMDNEEASQDKQEDENKESNEDEAKNQEEVQSQNKEVELPSEPSFKVSSGEDVSPRFILGYLVPKYPSLGETQNVKIKIKDQAGIESVKMTIKKQDEEETIMTEKDMKMMEGEDNKSGLWEANWTLPEDYDQEKAKLTIKATSGEKEENELTYFIFIKQDQQEETE